MNQPLNKIYPFKVWLVATLLGSFILSIGFTMQESPPDTLWDGFTAVVNIIFYSFVLSLPAFLFFYFLFRFLSRKNVAPGRSKNILCGCGIIVLILVFAFFELNIFAFNPESIVPWSYTAGLLIACFGCRITATKPGEYPIDDMITISIARTDSDDPVFQELATELEEELKARDGKDNDFYAQLNEIGKLEHVIVAYVNDEPVGCAGLREYSEDMMEIKRMYVTVNWRGKGIASLLLEELEEWCRELNYTSCVLETGKNQPEAISLYKKNGYKIVPNFGRYIGSPNSVCFKKELTWLLVTLISLCIR